MPSFEQDNELRFTVSKALQFIGLPSGAITKHLHPEPFTKRRYVVDFSSITQGLKKFRAVQNLVAGNNVINHNLGLSNSAVIVETRDNATGSLTASSVVSETANSTTISVSNAQTNVRITIIG